jgi:hypothetical protein
LGAGRLTFGAFGPIRPNIASQGLCHHPLLVVRLGVETIKNLAFGTIRPNTAPHGSCHHLFFHMSVLFKTDASFWWSGLGAAKLACGAFGPIRPKINF